MGLHSANRRNAGQARASFRSVGLAATVFCLCGGWLAVSYAQSSGRGLAPAAPGTRPATAGQPAVVKPSATRPAASRPAARAHVLEPKQVGGEPDSIVQVANLIYAGSRSSKCFSDHFLIQAEKESVISTSRRFHAVKLDSDELFGFPLVIMTGEGPFGLGDAERENLRTFVMNGGFLLASAGCSSPEWDRCFRVELARVFPENSLEVIEMEHPVFHTVYDITALTAHQGLPKPLEGIVVRGRLGVLYSQEGLNDTAHAQGCCCCGGNEITNALQVNVNILGYALAY
ncbi:MAG: DUF4159 domain-containing protein [Phycisphaerae bacterium]|nr:DUF4159 domain-containing protein [Phycisphaerae bacterium]